MDMQKTLNISLFHMYLSFYIFFQGIFYKISFESFHNKLYTKKDSTNDACTVLSVQAFKIISCHAAAHGV